MSEVAKYLEHEILTAVAHATTPISASPTAGWYEQGRPSIDTWLAQLPFENNVVFLVEGLGKLHFDVQQWFVNQLHILSCHRSYTKLDRIHVVLFGGIELYDLAQDAEYDSPFDAVFHKLHLLDLSERQTLSLLHIGLGDSVPQATLPDLASEVYKYLAGHPYLTQRMGAKIDAFWSIHRRLPSTTEIESIVANIREEECRIDEYLDKLGNLIQKRNLVETTANLIPYSDYPASDRRFFQLQLLGIAKRTDGNWTARNLLIETWLEQWLSSLPVKKLRNRGALLREMADLTCFMTVQERQATLVRSGLDRLISVTVFEGTALDFVTALFFKLETDHDHAGLTCLLYDLRKNFARTASGQEAIDRYLELLGR